MFTLPHGTWKDNIRSVIWDWRQKSQAKGKTRWSLKQNCQLLVCFPAVAVLRNKGPRHRRKICANSLWLYYYYYYTQSLPSKNKNINYISYISTGFSLFVQRTGNPYKNERIKLTRKNEKPLHKRTKNTYLKKMNRKPSNEKPFHKITRKTDTKEWM